MSGIMDHANQKVKPVNDVPLYRSDDICEGIARVPQDCISPFHHFVRASETNAMRDCLKELCHEIQPNQVIAKCR